MSAAAIASLNDELASLREEAAETTTAALSAVSKLLAEADMKLGSQHEAALRRARAHDATNAQLLAALPEPRLVVGGVGGRRPVQGVRRRQPRAAGRRGRSAVVRRRGGRARRRRRRRAVGTASSDERSRTDAARAAAVGARLARRFTTASRSAPSGRRHATRARRHGRGRRRRPPRCSASSSAAPRRRARPRLAQLSRPHAHRRRRPPAAAAAAAAAAAVARPERADSLPKRTSSTDTGLGLLRGRSFSILRDLGGRLWGAAAGATAEPAPTLKLAPDGKRRLSLNGGAASGDWLAGELWERASAPAAASWPADRAATVGASDELELHEGAQALRYATVEQLALCVLPPSWEAALRADGLGRASLAQPANFALALQALAAAAQQQADPEVEAIDDHNRLSGAQRPSTRFSLDEALRGSLGDADGRSSTVGMPRRLTAEARRTSDGTFADEEPSEGSAAAAAVAFDFDEEERDEGGGGELRCATLNGLVRRLTHHSIREAHFLDAFLLTYRSFTTPLELLALLKSRFAVPMPHGLVPAERLRSTDDRRADPPPRRQRPPPLGDTPL